MSTKHRAPHARDAVLLALLALAFLGVLGCDRAGVPPTASSPPEQASALAASARDAEEPQGIAHRAEIPWPPHAVIPEAREALGVILTGEQVYLQRFGTFVDAADTSAIRSLLGVHLDVPSRHWAFSVSDASTAGFVARALGRDGTEAEGFLVTLGFVRGRPPVLSVKRSRQN